MMGLGFCFKAHYETDYYSAFFLGLSGKISFVKSSLHRVEIY